LKDAYVVDAKKTIMKIHLVKDYPIDQQNELREFRRD
jgi:hypothetical protein